ncbi:hypothetical protein D3C87_1952030 [compost metagenome]
MDGLIQNRNIGHCSYAVPVQKGDHLLQRAVLRSLLPSRIKRNHIRSGFKQLFYFS